MAPALYEAGNECFLHVHDFRKVRSEKAMAEDNLRQHGISHSRLDARSVWFRQGNFRTLALRQVPMRYLTILHPASCPLFPGLSKNCEMT
ncbi:hypothetical protein TH15_07910 [Thalassospira profundimaris]|uniref:Uncharacterized protein n=1 Tax=Thalassospira indica TaxID=1891279 RepID=A0ABM6Y198_9PROT|nr:hypothetical protein DY252_17030 [Thalassospira indica]OAZ14141.1 hypothetical protein TH15_07910 [Thalassospira profundimaris]